MDGGICSQINQYYCGIKIHPDFQPEFDLDFWNSGVGKDCLGNQNRPFELLTLFPMLTFIKCKNHKATFYRRFLQSNDSQTTPPVYINNYRFGRYRIDRAVFNTYFSLDTAYLPAHLNSLKNSIIQSHSCGIHFRRGDLATHNYSNYGVFSEDYFNKALDYIVKKDPDVHFFAFSDDPVWVKKWFSQKDSFPLTIVEGNTGAEDLLLLAYCKYIIASQGTAGKYAALINGNSFLILMAGDPNNKCCESYNNKIVI